MELKRRSNRWRNRRREREGNAAFHQLYKRLQHEKDLQKVIQCNTIETRRPRRGEWES